MITIICIGKIKEKYIDDMIDDYSKRLSKYHKLNIVELKEDTLVNEKNDIIKHLDSKSYVISLDIDGKLLDSVELSKVINDGLTYNSNITFIIGESLGLHEDIKKLSNLRLSFGKMTYPHGLFRAILLEQIYRSFKIINNESYHK